EAQANGGEADRRVLGDAERAAEVEIAFGGDFGGFERHVERGGDCLERHAGAGDQRLEQHIAGTELEPGAAGRRMQARDRERAPGLHLAGDVRVIERAFGLQGDDGRLRGTLVALLERRLHGAQRNGIHWQSLHFEREGQTTAGKKKQAGRTRRETLARLKRVCARLRRATAGGGESPSPPPAPPPRRPGAWPPPPAPPPPPRARPPPPT